MDRLLKLLPKQSLQMTQELQTALLILSLPISDLEEYYSNELEKNPLFEPVYYQKSIRYDPSDHQTLYQSSRFESLFFQARCILNDKDKKIAERLLSQLDERGFFSGDLVAIACEENTSEIEVEKVRKILLQLEPMGICSLNNREFFLLQLEENRLLYQIVENHYEDLLNQRFSKIAKRLKTTKKFLQTEVIPKLKKLKVSPFTLDQEVIWTRPDITVEDKDGKLDILINEEGVFPIKLNTKYEKILTSPTLDKEEKLFLKKALSAGKWLVKNVQIRNKTLLELTNLLLETQKCFFLNGEKPIPLALKDVANDLNLSHSTVSRAVNNKVIQTPFGLYTLKFFFKKGLENGNCAFEKLKGVIESENKLNPYTDLELCEELQKQGVQVSRRSITKYRKKLLINPASKRKRF